MKTNLAALFCTFSRLPIFFRFVGSYTELAYSIVGLTMDVYAADFTDLVQSFKLRRINPNVLLPLPIVLSMCLSQVMLLEMVTPRRLLYLMCVHVVCKLLAVVICS